MDSQPLANNDHISIISKVKQLKRRLISQFLSNLKVNVILIFGFFMSIYIYYCIFQYLFYQNHFDAVHGTEGKSCPACFGNRACPDFYRGEINIKGFYRLPFMQDMKTRQIYESYRGLYQMQKEVILKKLVTKEESVKIETWICDKNRHRHLDGKCHAKYALWFHIDYHPSKTMQLGHIALTKEVSPMMHCVTDRLYDRMKLRYRERHSRNVEIPLSRPEEIMILYSLYVNQQALMLQTFPSEDGWPFPSYLGACGRWVVEGHAGAPLDEFCQAKFWQKLTIVINLLSLPQRLERSDDKSEQWVLYIGDPAIENFVVDKVTLATTIVDLEHMLVVDVKHVREMRLPRHSEALHVPARPCGHDLLGNYFNCTEAVDKDGLCGRESSDHNVHTVCAMLLGNHGDGKAPSCLLDDPRLDKVNKLLHQCVLDIDNRRQQLDSLLKELHYLLQSVKKTDL